MGASPFFASLAGAGPAFAALLPSRLLRMPPLLFLFVAGPLLLAATRLVDALCLVADTPLALAPPFTEGATARP